MGEGKRAGVVRGKKERNLEVKWCQPAEEKFPTIKAFLTEGTSEKTSTPTTEEG